MIQIYLILSGIYFGLLFFKAMSAGKTNPAFIFFIMWAWAILCVLN